MENNKGVSWGVFSISLMAMLLVGMFMGCLFIKGVKGNDKCKLDPHKELTKEEMLKIDIDKKLDILLSGNTADNGHSPILEKSRGINEFKSDDLVRILYKNSDKKEFDEKDFDKEKDYCYDSVNHKLLDDGCGKASLETSYDELRAYFDESKFAQKYKSVYGLELEKDFYDACPQFILNKEENKIYTRYECGGTGFIDHIDYRFNYVQENDKFFVYVAVGFAGPDGIVYSDYEMTKESGFTYTKDFKIDESNYKKFSEYKIVFEKEGEEYHFSRVEKL